MHASVRVLLNQILDYAGMFPPAKLPLEEALRIYLDAKKSSPHRWMLGRFVCPTTRLTELLTLAKAHPDGSLLHVTALGQQSSTANGSLPHLPADIRTIEEFRLAWRDDRVIDVYEVALPQDVRRHPPSSIKQDMAPFEHARLRGFLELPKTSSWRQDLLKLCASLRGTGVGVKLRTGSTTAQAFPSDANVAYFIDQCRQANLPWKATAGLHHPRRHWDERLQVWHHGFLNVFCAGVLAWTNSMVEADLVEILSDSQAQHFRFEENAMAWKSWSCTTAQITETRANFATSFGCCSFDEPCADLIAMGLLKSKPEA